ncbi:MAG TPA: hypothetical protein PLB62_04740 [Candidatus Sumerlaeota bacterium]|nr:hypothetical protein [Candidatus Sumerlaeota bacterium]
MTSGLDFTGILIGTGVLLGVTYIIVVPFVSLISGVTRVPAARSASGADVPEGEALKGNAAAGGDIIDRLPAGTFILVHMLALGIAGYLFGLHGLYFIAFSTKSRMWPGIIALILGSFLGLAQR